MPANLNAGRKWDHIALIVTLAALAAVAAAASVWAGPGSAAAGVVAGADATHKLFPSSCSVPSFGTATDFAAGTRPNAVAAGDFNRDGSPDLAAANSISNSISVLLGDGNGGFGSASSYAVGSLPNFIAVSDFNRDGNPDLVTSNNMSHNVSVLLGDGNGGFGAATNFAADGHPVSVAVGDFNRDGNPDLAVANVSGQSISVLLGNGSGSFGATTNFEVSFPNRVAVGDFNRDGNPDLVVTQGILSSVSVLLGNGSGGFGAATSFAVGALPFSVLVDDFNGNGNPDLAVANQDSNNVSVLLGNGSGGFSAPTNFAVGLSPESVTVGNFNRDGGPDLVTANRGLGSNSVSVLLNTCDIGTITATPTNTPAPPTNTPQATPTCSPGGGPYDIAVVYSDDGPPGKLIDYIEAEPDVALVFPIEARFSTPSLTELLNYDVVVVYPNIEYDDPVAMGNVIADYQDAGGIVVAKNSNWWGPPYGMEGRWMTGGYTMFTYPSTPRTSTDTLGAHDPTHPLMQGVITMTAFFRSEVTLTAGASQVAAWTDGLPLVAHKTTNGHTAVGINALLSFPEEGWDGDFGTLIVNAARWLRPGVPCGSVTPQSTPTRTATRTATATQPPLTGTPTPCPMTFTDVLPTDFFYVPVRYLYCAGVISGYADNTFRPYNTTTRGQLTKIVVLGFGIPLYTPPQPTFTDVPATHTFYQYIETAAYEGIVSGYSDGTFRPGNDVTRGQLSKIVVVAAAWPLVNPPTPTFTDVPTNHTFYTYIETAYDHEIISGYADGTFRPGNNATRGQISKIVYNAVIQP